MPVLSGNAAAAEALKLIDPDVVPAYPITPSTSIVEKFSQFVANGEVATEFLPVESEHAAMSACIGAAASGGRVFTATASQGLALMHEVLFNASGMRLPIILINGNRALSAPLSIHGDHSDIMAQRDSGWIQVFAKDAQEVFDFLILITKLVEKQEIRLPAMIGMDGFWTTHTEQNLEILKKSEVQKFIGPKIREPNLLNTKNPISIGTATKPDFFMEFKRAQLEGFLNVFKIWPKISKEFSKNFGRNYSAIETFNTKDAETIFVLLGSTFGTAKIAAKNLRKKGKKVGIIRPIFFRPFPQKEFIEKIKNSSAQKIIIFERVSPSGSSASPLFLEIAATLFVENIKIFPFTFGLGGKEVLPEYFEKAFDICGLGKSHESSKSNWLGI